MSSSLLSNTRWSKSATMVATCSPAVLKEMGPVNISLISWGAMLKKGNVWTSLSSSQIPTWNGCRTGSREAFVIASDRNTVWFVVYGPSRGRIGSISSAWLVSTIIGAFQPSGRKVVRFGVSCERTGVGVCVAVGTGVGGVVGVAVGVMVGVDDGVGLGTTGEGVPVGLGTAGVAVMGAGTDVPTTVGRAGELGVADGTGVTVGVGVRVTGGRVGSGLAVGVGV